MSDVGRVQTARLALDAVTIDDLGALHPMFSDRALWMHLASGRHESTQQTATYLAGKVAEWDETGFGYWTARLSVDLAGTPAGTVVGWAAVLVGLPGSGTWATGSRRGRTITGRPTNWPAPPSRRLRRSTPNCWIASPRSDDDAYSPIRTLRRGSVHPIVCASAPRRVRNAAQLPPNPSSSAPATGRPGCG